MFLTPNSLASMMPGVIESSAQEAVSLSFFFPFELLSSNCSQTPG
jgi:hypothetical protein